MPAQKFKTRDLSVENVTKDERDARSLMSVKQDVKLLNENIVRCTVENALLRLIEKHRLKAEDIDYFLPHYSSGFSVDKLLDGLKISISLFHKRSGLLIWNQREYRFSFHLHYSSGVFREISAKKRAKSVVLYSGKRTFFLLFYVA